MHHQEIGQTCIDNQESICQQQTTSAYILGEKKLIIKLALLQEWPHHTFFHILPRLHFFLEIASVIKSIYPNHFMFMQKLYARKVFHQSKLNEKAFDTQSLLEISTSYTQSIHKIV